jgi:hypothetical protein
MRNDNENVLTVQWYKGEKQVFPKHRMVKSWLFSQETEDEAVLANAMAVIAERNDVDSNHLQHLFPAVLRMLKCDSPWSK